MLTPVGPMGAIAVSASRFLEANNQPASVSQPLALSVFSGEASPYDVKAPILQQLIAIRQIVRVQQPESPAALALDCCWRGKP